MKNIETPCYLFDEELFLGNIELFHTVLCDFFPNKSIIGYSFKTNSLPYIVNCARKNGCYAEVVSATEYHLALEMKYDAEKIIYNGPVKDKKSFLWAIEHGSLVNIDSKREISWLNELPQSKTWNVGIRINFDLEAVLPGHTLMGEEGGRFGFCADNSELAEAISAIRAVGNINIACLHMHVSSKTKSPLIYEQLVKKAAEIAQNQKLSLKYIDVGGSFFGGGDDGSAYEKYVKIISEAMKKCGMNGVGVIVEPGASLIASTMKYVVSVVDKKRTSRNCFVITDGSRLHVDPFFSKNKFLFEIMSSSSDIEEEQVICGFTCMEKDRFMKLKDYTKLNIEDNIVFDCVGSYTIGFNSFFINGIPRVYVKDNGKYRLIRRESNAKDYKKMNYYEM